MAIYIRLLPGVKVRIGRRGRTRWSLGPRPERCPRLVRRWRLGSFNRGWAVQRFTVVCGSAAKR